LAKKQKKQEAPSWELSNIGLMLFTSLNIILLAFFIMLQSMAIVDEKREVIVLGSLIGTFGILPKGLSPTKGEGQSMSPTTKPFGKVRSDMDNMKNIINESIIEDKINTLRGKKHSVMSFQETVLFPKNEVEIIPEMEKILLEFADIMRGKEYHIMVEGHTDDMPPQRADLYNNWSVSATRAANVVKFFIEKGGIDPNRLSGFGYAGEYPIVTNNSPKNRARNRRVDIVLDARDQEELERHKEETKKRAPLTIKGFDFNLFDKN
jgi:chemotaxis protein MotB